MDKATLVSEMVSAATAIAQANEALQAAYAIYFDNGYNSGGTDAIADADLTGAGFPFTAAQLGSLVTLIEQLDKMLEGQATTPADYSATLNVVRSKV
jgi:hypothetical protein